MIALSTSDFEKLMAGWPELVGVPVYYDHANPTRIWPKPESVDQTENQDAIDLKSPT
jgi:hypothetical protein